MRDLIIWPLREKKKENVADKFCFLLTFNKKDKRTAFKPERLA